MKLAILMALAAARCVAQNHGFEVAAIKHNPSGSSMMSLGGPDLAGGRFVARNVPLRALIRFAYNVPDFQLSGGAGWISSERFDVDAKADGPLTPDQARLRLRTLLQERFQLAIRTLSENKPIYALVIAKKGTRLRPSLDEASPALGAPTGSVPPVAGGLPRGAARSQPGGFRASAVTLESLVRMLAAQLQRPVQDRTELSGLFDIDLKWTPEQIPEGLPAELRPDPSGPSIFTALEEQLGLKLLSTTGQVEILVIEKAERPTGN